MSIYTDERVMSKHSTDKRTDAATPLTKGGGDAPSFGASGPRAGNCGGWPSRCWRGPRAGEVPHDLPVTAPPDTCPSGPAETSPPHLAHAASVGQAVVPICVYEYVNIYIPDAPSFGASARVRGTAADGSGPACGGSASRPSRHRSPGHVPFGSGRNLATTPRTRRQRRASRRNPYASMST